MLFSTIFAHYGYYINIATVCIEREIDIIAEKLWIEIVSTGNCVAWVGSGLSDGCYVKIPALIDYLIEKCEPKNYENLLKQEKYFEIAELCKNNNEELYKNCLADKYGFIAPLNRPEYNNLVSTKFQSFVTTNFDPLLAEACDNHDLTVHYLPIIESKYIVLKRSFYIHGLALVNDTPTAENLVLATSEFETAYNRDGGPTWQFVLNLLTEHNLLFMGCALTEPEINECFNAMIRIQAYRKEKYHEGAIDRNRIILLPNLILNGMTDEEIEHANDRQAYEKSRFENSLNISIIRYPRKNRDDKHIALMLILRKLRVYSQSSMPRITGESVEVS